MVVTSETPAKRIESLTAQVAPELAAEIRRLAEDGERSVRRQVAIAVREHVERPARASDLLQEQRAEDPEGAAGPARPGVDPAAAEGEA